MVGSWGFSKKPTAKIEDFALRKKGAQKTRIAKKAQKSMTKKRELIFNFNINNLNLNINSYKYNIILEYNLRI